MKKKKYMSDEDFAELKLSLEQALQHARGERNDLRTTALPAPPEPRWASMNREAERLPFPCEKSWSMWGYRR